MGHKSRWLGFRHALLGLCLAACGGAVGVSTVGGESHFLHHCADGCGPGLDCVADVCTRGCVVDQDSCTDLAKDATCTAASIEPGAIAVCDAACTQDAACSSLGENFECQAGFCRQAPPNVPPTGSAGEPNASPGAGGTSTTLPDPPSTGGEAAAWEPPSRCLLPYDAGPCEANMTRFAVQDGHCMRVSYGGCEGNDNRFFTMEECLAVCEGSPLVNACPEGRVRQTICIGCGLAGGCGETLDACAQPCEAQAECVGMPTLGCTDGVCQAYGCD